PLERGRLVLDLAEHSYPRSVASRSPSAISTAPVIPSSARRTRERRRTSPALAATLAYAESHMSVMKQNTRPSASSAANDVPPNCGSRLVKNTAIFGFPRLLSRPCRYADRRARDGSAGWTARPRTAASSAAPPSHATKAAPAIRNATHAGPDAPRWAAAPAAAAIVQTAWPVATPAAVA